MARATRLAHRPGRRDVMIAVILSMIALALPLLGLTPYILSQVALFFIWSAVVIQWNLVFGVAGIMSLAHVAIFAFGAYSTAILASYTGLPFWVCFLLSAPCAMLFSFVIGAISLRMRGDHVAVVTFAISILMSTVILNDVGCFRSEGVVCYPFSGGSRGLSGYGDFGWAKLLGYKSRALGDYYLTFGVALLSLIVALLLIHGPFGLAFRAIRDSETYARARGIAFERVQLLVFILTGAMTGLAGGAYAGYIKTVGPTLLSMNTLVFLLSMIIVGGRGSTWGPVLGAAALVFADMQFQALAGWRTGALSAITIACVVLYPAGLTGVGAQIGRLFGARARTATDARAEQLTEQPQ
ncbi:MAG: branched-chain amino acid ABC transporter permease [Rhodovulum sulfidophilum]|uniref:Branched-chain amino acid ABC transporter permease n=1 Tax=Rhodovulum sulfidophilum TaxID=35806 RepID=A0A2W5PMV1_RHOSU|nr:MAG: branched-chain amino acid ABC transporter permease [Rhodovulum sulfidophilum]